MAAHRPSYEKMGRWPGQQATTPSDMTKHSNSHPICSNILESIGNTPMVRINRIAKDEGLLCDVVVKCEFMNPGGSVKDRIAKKMVEEAELLGRLVMEPSPTVIIEPTSGNTGIGLALIGAVKGYPTIIALPEKMSREKVDVMKGLGATVIRTPTEAACSCPDSHYGVARRMNGEIENSVMLDQFANPHNPEAHYGETALEIWEACAGKVDMVVIGAGTGGSITGITRKLRELNPSIIVVGVDPFGSNLSGSTEHQAYLIEGIGCDFVPDVLDPGLVDLWIRTEDKESFLMARRMIRDEGILCGGSSGSAMAGLVKAMKHYDLGPDKRAVVLLPDSVRNYMSKFLNDDWMLIKDFISPQDIPNACQQSGHSDRMIATSLVCHEDSVAVEKSTTISSLSTTNAIVLGDEDHVCGILSVEKMAEKIGLCGEAAVLDMSVSKMVATDFGVVSEEMPLGHVLQFLQTDYPVILKTGSGGYRIVDKPKTIMKMLLTKSASCPEAMIERLSI